jgi:hypothetical protein
MFANGFVVGVQSGRWCPEIETVSCARSHRGLAFSAMVGRSSVQLTRGSRGGNQLARRASVQYPCQGGSYDERRARHPLVIESKEIGRTCHEYE